MMDLEDLEELFEELDYNKPTPSQIYQMYGIYLNDFIRNPLQIKGRIVKCNANPSNHWLFKGKPSTFVHIITRESKIKKMRDFDHQRANRIHWIRPILERANDTLIWYFERLNEDNENCEYYWYESKDFLVILKQIEPDVLLVTSFYVDKDSKTKFRRWYQEYRELQKKTPLRE